MAGSGFRGTSSLLLVVAVAATGGFLYWVYDQAQSLDQTVTPEMEDTTEVASSELTAETLAADPDAAAGRDAVLDSVEVSESLGRAVFTVMLADTLEYPVLLGSQLIQQGTTVYGGDHVTLEGRVFVLNDSIRDEWRSRGAVDEESGDRIPGVASFLLAEEIDIH